MQRCVELAKNGLGTTYPNPLVGSVIVYNNQIIGEGWHKKAGEAHAEVNAIASVKDSSLRARVVAIAALGIFQQMPISDAARRKLRAIGHSSTLA